MLKRMTERLRCPSCRGPDSLRLRAESTNDDDVVGGALTCVACERNYAIVNGIPRFVESRDNYAENFGFQWQRWRSAQIDRLAGHDVSTRRFFAEVPWDREWMRGKRILDAGCGAGRFADVAASHGAHVIACDLSDAVEACRATTAVHDGRVQVVQASIYDLPFPEGSFDAVYCFGVIQHTPDPARTMSVLPRYVRPGGWLAYDFYQRSGWDHPWVTRHILRRWTPDWSPTRLLRVSQVLTAVFFPFGALLARIPILNRLLPAYPVAMVRDRSLSLRQEYLWTLLDTFDWYGPRYELRQDYRDVSRLLSALGMQDVAARPGVVTARAPSKDEA